MPDWLTLRSQVLFCKCNKDANCKPTFIYGDIILRFTEDKQIDDDYCSRTNCIKTIVFITTNLTRAGSRNFQSL